MLILGLDTGGTYTDAVLLEPRSRRILARGKVFTDKANLPRCIGQCLSALPREALWNVSLFCVSTTLATNAVVEGDGGRVGLLLMGGTSTGTLPPCAVRQINGRLDIRGKELQAVDPDEVRRAVDDLHGSVDAVAVSGFAGVRNPAHETAVRDIVHGMTGLPVVCGHELSSSLGHCERTVTAVMNAGLIPKTESLIQAVRATAREAGLTAPIMIVRGDGSLIRDGAARERPIETVLSGPAASIAGGLYLSGVDAALLLDMGGTTTDIALARGGGVRLTDRGAWVGGWRTMVRAASVATFGLGGDSRIAPGATPGELVVGPRRVQPLCVAAAECPGVRDRLEALGLTPPDALSIASDGVLYRVIRPPEATAPVIERETADALREAPLSLSGLAALLRTGISGIPAEDMCRRGLLARIALTPTDILHAAGDIALWDAGASRAGTGLFAAKMAMPVPAFLATAKRIITGRLAAACVEAAMRLSGDGDAHRPTLDALVNGAATGANDVLAASFSLKLPIVAVGAPAAAWMPAVAKRLGTELIIPDHADVANAAGAAVGRIQARFAALVRPDRKNAAYTAYTPEARRDFPDRDAAERWALANVRRLAQARAEEWGGANAAITERVTPRHVVDGDGAALFVETNITVEAAADPSAITDTETGGGQPWTPTPCTT